ncbi:MAG: phospholipase D-like domain-containing protein [Bacteroidaceae bacterium]
MKVLHLFSKSALLFVFCLALFPIRAAEVTETRSDTLLLRYLNEHGVQATDSNRVQLIFSGHEKFEMLFEDIRQARHYIHLEYFNFRNDSIAGLLFELLKEKVKEGVAVRAMFDDFGNKSNNRPLKKHHLEELRAAGIDIIRFDPIRFPYVNHIFHRDHRKIVVIDGRVAYTGGMNIADYYIEGLPEIGPWRDMHLRLEGKSVQDLHQILIDTWEGETKERIPDEERQHYAPSVPEEEPVGIGPARVAIVDRKAKDKRLKKLLRRTFVETINGAQDSLTLINPYFTPTRKVRSALKKAAERGLKLKIMVSPNGDIPVTPNASLYTAKQLMKRGAEVWLFYGGFHHSKTMTVDGTHCTVGSANLNSRSLRCDYEVNTFIFNQEATAEIDSLFRDDCKQSKLMTREVWKKDFSPWKRFRCWLANLLTPFL